MNSAAKKIIILTGAMVALAIGTSWVRPPQPVTAGQPHVIGVAPTAFIETKISGERISHPMIHAKIRVQEQSDLAGLAMFANQFFHSRVQCEAEASSKNMVWITFYFADKPEKLDGKVRTYREIFVREASAWYRLYQGGKQLL